MRATRGSRRQLFSWSRSWSRCASAAWADTSPRSFRWSWSWEFSALLTSFVSRRWRLGSSPGPEGGLAWRLGAWTDALNVIRAHPLAGVGLGNYVAVRVTTLPASMAVVSPDQMTLLHPHNIFLQQVAEVGILGGVAYLALWATALWAGWQSSARMQTRFGPALGVFYAFVAIAVMNMGENMFLEAVAPERVRLHTIAWILMAVVVAEWTRAPPRETYRLRLQLIGAPAPSSGSGHRVAIVASQENIVGGGSLWLAERRQLGSLSLRAFTRERTAYGRLRAAVAPLVPSPFANPAVALIALIAYQSALAALVYALLFARHRDNGLMAMRLRADPDAWRQRSG